MQENKITSEIIADALISMNESFGICDNNTVKGLRNSKKKEILKSTKEGSFSRFEQEIIKRQNRKM